MGRHAYPSQARGQRPIDPKLREALMRRERQGPPEGEGIASLAPRRFPPGLMRQLEAGKFPPGLMKQFNAGGLPTGLANKQVPLELLAALQSRQAPQAATPMQSAPTPMTASLPTPIPSTTPLSIPTPEPAPTPIVSQHNLTPTSAPTPAPTPIPMQTSGLNTMPGGNLESADYISSLLMGHPILSDILLKEFYPQWSPESPTKNSNYDTSGIMALLGL